MNILSVIHKRTTLFLIIVMAATLCACAPKLEVNIAVSGLEADTTYSELPSFYLDYTDSYNQAQAINRTQDLLDKINSELYVTLNGKDVSGAFNVLNKQAVIADRNILANELKDGLNVLQVAMVADKSNVLAGILNTKQIVPFNVELLSDEPPLMAVSKVIQRNGMVEIDGFVKNPRQLSQFTINSQNIDVAENGAFSTELSQASNYRFVLSDQNGESVSKTYQRNIGNQVIIKSRVNSSIIDTAAISRDLNTALRGSHTLPQDVLNALNPISINILGLSSVHVYVDNKLNLSGGSLNTFKFGQGTSNSGRADLALTMNNMNLTATANICINLLFISPCVGLPVEIFASSAFADTSSRFSVARNGKLSVNLDRLNLSMRGTQVYLRGVIPYWLQAFVQPIVSAIASMGFVSDILSAVIKPNIANVVSHAVGDAVLNFDINTPLANLSTGVSNVSTSSGQLYADLSGQATPSSNIKTTLGVLKNTAQLSNPGGSSDLGVNVSESIINQVMNAAHVSGATDLTLYMNNPFEKAELIDADQVDTGDWRIRVETVLPVEITMQAQNRAVLNIPGLVMKIDQISSAGDWAPILSNVLVIDGAAKVAVSSRGNVTLDIIEDDINFNVVNVEVLGANSPLIDIISKEVVKLAKPIIVGAINDIGAVSVQLPLDQFPVDVSGLTYKTNSGVINLNMNINL